MSNRQKADSIKRMDRKAKCLHMLINMRNGLSTDTYKSYLKQLKGIL